MSTSEKTSEKDHLNGFLTLKDLDKIQKERNLKKFILTIPDSNNKKTTEKKNDYENRDINVIEELLKNQDDANPLAIDLRLGEQVFISTEELPFNLGSDAHPNDSISIKPGEFAILLTKEEVNVPDFMLALISMKFKIKLKGLINVSGFHVDPGYEGNIMYSVYNAGPNPIILQKDEAIFTIIFAGIETESKRKNPTFNKINFIRSDHISGLLGAPVSLQGLHDRIKTLEQWNKILIGLISGIAIALIAALFGGLGK